MFACYQPDYHATNIFELPVSFFREQGITCVLCDLDNTLDSYRLHTPSSRTIAWYQTWRNAGIQLIVISNNREPRVRTYAETLGVNYLYSSRKPLVGRLLKFLRQHEIDPSKTALVGDQLLTDVACGRKAKLLTVLTEPIVKEDQWTTRFNRLLDRPIRRHLAKKGRLRAWEDYR